MTASNLKKFVLTPVLLSTAVFSTLTLPLALLGSKPVDIQLQEEPVFSGQLRDVAAPYLGLATALSVGAGVASVALTGWRQSSRKSTQIEEQLLGLQQHLKEKEELLEELRLSNSRLEASELSAFLNDEVSKDQNLTTCAVVKEAQPVIVEMPVQVVEPLVIAAQPAEPQMVGPRQLTVQDAASLFSSAQPFLAYAQASHLGRKPTAAVDTEVQATTAAPALLPVEELQNQLKQIMAQMETLKNALHATPQPITPEAKVPANSN